MDAAADAAEVVVQGSYVLPPDRSHKPVGRGYRTVGPFAPIRSERLFEPPGEGMLFGEYGRRNADDNWGLGPAGGGSPEADDW